MVALTSFCAYAVGNTAGFGPLTGGAIRYRFYARLGFEPAEVARIVAFITIAFGFGLAGVMALGLLVDPVDVAAPIGLPPSILLAIGGALLAALAALPAWAAFGSGRAGLARPPSRCRRRASC